MLKLKLPYFSHLMRRAHSLEKTLVLSKIEGKKRRRKQRMRWTQLNGHEFEIVEDRRAWHAAVQGVAKSQAQLSK